jgi:hypothetical protein
MSNEERNDEKIRQEASGIGNTQAAGPGATAITIFGIPIDRLLIGILITTICCQGLGYICSLTALNPVVFLYFGICFPFSFGFPAMFGLVMGIAFKNKKIIILSIVSGALSLLLLGPLFFLKSIVGLFK